MAGLTPDSRAPVTHQLTRTRNALTDGVERGWHGGAVVSTCRSTGEAESAAVGRTLDGHAMDGGCLPPWFCAAKPLLGLMLATLVSRGEAGWDDEVARYVPRFARAGKERVTIRHVLTHSIGLLNDPVEILGLDWDTAVRTISRTRPEPGWAPGREHSYLPFTSWYLIGEVLTRSTGQELGPLLTEHVLRPLELSETYVGMTPEEYRHNRVRLAGVGTNQVRGAAERHQFRLPIDDPDVCCGVGPMSVRGTMADLAKLYAILGFSQTPPLSSTTGIGCRW
jgi:hypothetical protein